MSAALHATKNYKLFEVSEFNRDVGKTSALERSMKTHGYIPAYPLHCYKNGNGKLKIKAGHHRFDVAQRLGIQVWYVVCDDHAGIHELEGGTRPWTFADYVASFCKVQSVSHLSIVDFSQRTGIGLKQSASMLAGESASSGNQNAHVKDGTYQIKAGNHAEVVGRIVIRCKEAGVSFATVGNFVAAICSMVYLDEFDVDTFVHRVATNPSMMRKQATMAQYQEMIEAVYNHHAQYKVPLAFAAREAARNRAAVKKPAPKLD